MARKLPVDRIMTGCPPERALHKRRRDIFLGSFTMRDRGPVLGLRWIFAAREWQISLLDSQTKARTFAWPYVAFTDFLTHPDVALLGFFI